MNSSKPDQWSPDREQAMSELVRMFPTLQTARGVQPWKPTEFVKWAALHGHSSGSAHAVRFVLLVWNSSADWREILKEAELSPLLKTRRYSVQNAGVRADAGAQ